MEKSKTSELYKALKAEIVAFRYDTKEPINEKEVAEKFGVSRTPAREALGMLVQDGYLRKYPRLGYFIHEISESDYYKLLYLRYTLEKGVIAHIISNCKDSEIQSLYEFCKDTEIPFKEFAGSNMHFHLGMAAITRNEYLISAVQSVFDHMLRSPSEGNYRKFAQNPHADHKKLIQAMLDRNMEEAMQLLRYECRREDDIELWF